MCQTKDSKRITYYDLDLSGEDWAQMDVQECVAVLEDLDFACSYNVELISTTTKKVIKFNIIEDSETIIKRIIIYLSRKDFLLYFCCINCDIFKFKLN